MLVITKELEQSVVGTEASQISMAVYQSRKCKNHKKYNQQHAQKTIEITTQPQVVIKLARKSLKIKKMMHNGQRRMEPNKWFNS